MAYKGIKEDSELDVSGRFHLRFDDRGNEILVRRSPKLGNGIRWRHGISRSVGNCRSVVLRGVARHELRRYFLARRGKRGLTELKIIRDDVKHGRIVIRVPAKVDVGRSFGSDEDGIPLRHTNRNKVDGVWIRVGLVARRSRSEAASFSRQEQNLHHQLR